METEITPHTRELIDIVNAEHERTGVITYYPFIHQPTVVVFDPVNDVSRARNCWHAYVVYPRSPVVRDRDDDVPQAKLSSLVERARHYALLRLSAVSGAAAASFLPSLPPSPQAGPKPRG
jgi:hypothetical protein